MSLVQSKNLTAEVITEKLPVVSVDNSGTAELAHNSSTVRVDLDAPKKIKTEIE